MPIQHTEIVSGISWSVSDWPLVRLSVAQHHRRGHRARNSFASIIFQNQHI